MQFHVLSFEGPDAYAHAGGLASRVDGLTESLAALGLWNANNTYGFERNPWARLREASRITTVSRYMKQRMWAADVDPLVVPNGLPPDAFEDPEPEAVRALRSNPSAERAMRRAGRWTARRFAWPKVLQGVFLPRLNGAIST